MTYITFSLPLAFLTQAQFLPDAYAVSFFLCKFRVQHCFSVSYGGRRSDLFKNLDLVQYVGLRLSSFLHYLLGVGGLHKYT